MENTVRISIKVKKMHESGRSAWCVVAYDGAELGLAGRIKTGGQVYEYDHEIVLPSHVHVNVVQDTHVNEETGETRVTDWLVVS